MAYGPVKPYQSFICTVQFALNDEKPCIRNERKQFINKIILFEIRYKYIGLTLIVFIVNLLLFLYFIYKHAY